MSEALNELRRLTADAGNRRTETGIPRVAMVQGEIPEHRLAGIYEPMVNLILQGGKTLMIGSRVLHYDPASYFVMSVDMPATGAVHAGGPGKPYLAVALTIEPAIVSALLTDLPATIRQDGETGAFSVCPVTPELLDAWTRMLRLRDRPDDIPALAPAYEREILYRVLQGPQGWMLRALAAPNSALSRVRRAIEWLRQHYAEPVEVDRLADVAAMSPSSFHRHFKAITSMSPIQFQKQIRLLQARQLLIADARTASSAAFEVGYESPSQFNREYTRFFGLPPASDASRIRGELDLAAAAHQRDRQALSRLPIGRRRS